MLDSASVLVLNQYFDKILILSIERNSNRIPEIRKKLNGLNFEIFIGVDGSTLDVQDLKEKGEIAENIDDVYKQNNIDYMNLKVGKLLNNQIAVALSHKKIYKYIIDHHLNKVLILEDDILPVEKNLHCLADTLYEVPNDWEILFLGHIYNNDFSFWGRLKYYYLINFMYKIQLRTDSVIRKRKSYPKDFSTLLKKQGGHIGTHAYAVHGAGAKKLLEIQTPLTHGASDLLMMDAVAKNKLIAYTCKYMFFEQNTQLSSSVYNNENTD